MYISLPVIIVAGIVWAVLNDRTIKHKWLAVPVMALLGWLTFLAF